MSKCIKCRFQTYEYGGRGDRLTLIFDQTFSPVSAAKAALREQSRTWAGTETMNVRFLVDADGFECIHCPGCYRVSRIIPQLEDGTMPEPEPLTDLKALRVPERGLKAYTESSEPQPPPSSSEPTATFAAPHSENQPAKRKRGRPRKEEQAHLSSLNADIEKFKLPPVLAAHRELYNLMIAQLRKDIENLKRNISTAQREIADKEDMMRQLERTRKPITREIKTRYESHQRKKAKERYSAASPQQAPQNAMSEAEYMRKKYGGQPESPTQASAPTTQPATPEPSPPTPQRDLGDLEGLI